MFNKMTINTSKDYTKFNKIKFNRPVNKKNMDRLVELNKEGKTRFHLFPIVVDKSFNIIDGQHRFEACKELGHPIYYLIDDVTDHWEEITAVNEAGKKHNILDVFNMLLAAGDPTAIEINKVIVKYPEKDKTHIIYFLTSQGAVTSKTTKLHAMKLKCHRLYKNHEEKVIFLNRFVENFEYIKAPHVQALFTFQNSSKVTQDEDVFSILKTNGFIPLRPWSTYTFREAMVSYYNKRKRGKNRALF